MTKTYTGDGEYTEFVTMEHLEIRALKAENERLRGALKFYADGFHMRMLKKSDNYELHGDTYIEDGTLAREALADKGLKVGDTITGPNGVVSTVKYIVEGE